MQFPRLTVRQLAFAIAMIALILAAERMGEARGRRSYPAHIQTIVIKRGARIDTITFDTNHPTHAAAFERRVAGLRAQKVDFRVEQTFTAPGTWLSSFLDPSGFFPTEP